MTITIGHTSRNQPINLYYEDAGEGQPIILIHGWPLNGRMWEHQVDFLVDNGYRVITYDRRGFGRSDKPWNGYDYDTLSDDLRAIISQLELDDIVLVGFSMGGGEVARYMGKHKGEHVAKCAFISSIAPYLLQTEDNEHGVPEQVFEDIKHGIRKDRPAFFDQWSRNLVNYKKEGEGPVSGAAVHDVWCNAMLGQRKATLDCVDAFGKTDLRHDVRSIQVPTLFIHGDADQIVPHEPTAVQGHNMVSGSRLEIIKDGPHGCVLSHHKEVNDILTSFLKS